MAIADILTDEIKKSDQQIYERSEIINVGKAIEREYKNEKDINKLKIDIEAASLEAAVLDAVKNANTKEFGKESNASRFTKLWGLVDKLLSAGWKFESKGITLAAKKNINYFVAWLKIIGGATDDQLKQISQNALFAKSEQSDRKTLKSLCNSCNADFDMDVLKAIMYFQSMVGEYKESNPAYGVDGIAWMYTLNALNAVLGFLDTGKKPAKTKTNVAETTTSDATVIEKTTTLPKGKAEDLNAMLVADANFDKVAYTAEAKYVKRVEKDADGNVLHEYVGMMKDGRYEWQGTILWTKEDVTNYPWCSKFVGEFEENEPWTGKMTRKNATSGKLETVERTYGVEIDKTKKLTDAEYNADDFTGYAKYEYKNADPTQHWTYEWYRLNGTWEGKGKQTRVDGDVYDGEWKEDKLEGKGKYTRASGENYEGGWKNNKKEGKGKYTYAPDNADKEKEYTGEWAWGKENGQGTLIYTDGSKITWIRKGYVIYDGKKTDKSGKMIAEYVHGKEKVKDYVIQEAEIADYTGFGTYTKKEADVEKRTYTGDRLDGKFDGQGTYEDKVTGEKYVWAYLAEEKSGEGILTSKDAKGNLITKKWYFKNDVLRVGQELDSEGKIIAGWKKNERMVPPKLEEKTLTTNWLNTAPVENFKTYTDAIEKSKNDATANITKLITKYKNILCYWDDKEQKTYLNTILAVMKTEDYDLNGTGDAEVASRNELAIYIMALAKKAGLGINGTIAKTLLDKVADEGKNINYGKGRGKANVPVLKMVQDEILALRKAQKQILNTMNAEIKKIEAEITKFETASWDPKNMISLGGMGGIAELQSAKFDETKKIISVLTQDGLTQHISLGSLTIVKTKDGLYKLLDTKNNYSGYCLRTTGTSFEIITNARWRNDTARISKFDEGDLETNISLNDIPGSVKKTLGEQIYMHLIDKEMTSKVVLTQTIGSNYKLNITDKGSAVAIEQHVDEKINGNVNDIININETLTANKADVDTFFKEGFEWRTTGLSWYDTVYSRTLLALGNTEAIYDKMDTLWDNTKKEIMGALDAETLAYT